jgi:hypothetical protein
MVAEVGGSRAAPVEGRGATAAAVDTLSLAGGPGRRSRADGARSWTAAGLGRTETGSPATANSTRGGGSGRSGVRTSRKDTTRAAAGGRALGGAASTWTGAGMRRSGDRSAARGCGGGPSILGRITGACAAGSIARFAAGGSAGFSPTTSCSSAAPCAGGSAAPTIGSLRAGALSETFAARTGASLAASGCVAVGEGATSAVRGCAELAGSGGLGLVSGAATITGSADGGGGSAVAGAARSSLVSRTGALLGAGAFGRARGRAPERSRLCKNLAIVVCQEPVRSNSCVIKSM